MRCLPLVVSMVMPGKCIQAMERREAASFRLGKKSQSRILLGGVKE